MLKLAAIVGPTAVGKTGTALKTAQLNGAEIISCDSMQVYRGMDIGTAKVTPEEQALVPHHLIDIVNIDEEYNVARYQKETARLIQTLNQQDCLPLLVGGTGLYYQAVVDNYQLMPLESSPELRDEYKQEISIKGIDHVYRQLQKIDPAYADKISPRDEKRIIRALEVHALTGQPFSRYQTRQENTYNFAAAGLYMERALLYQKIEERVETMFKEGFVEEVAGLLETGYSLAHKPMQALGYRQVIHYLQGVLTRDQMINAVKQETRRYAKRQLTWFNRDTKIVWFDSGRFKDENSLAESISTYFRGQLSTV